jgi:hypothetical protein
MDTISQLKQRNIIWQGMQAQTNIERIPSHICEIDQRLQGLPAYGVFSVSSIMGIGELRLFSHYLRHKQQQGTVVFVAPPAQLNAEFFVQEGLSLEKVLIVSSTKPNDAMWAVEQCLKSGCCSAVVYWGLVTEMTQIRRCMLAAEQQHASLIMLHDCTSLSLSQPISLKMRLAPTATGVELNIYKQKAGSPLAPFNVNLSRVWPDLYQDNTNRFLVSDGVHLSVQQQH